MSKPESGTTWVMPSDSSASDATPRTISYAYDATGRVGTVEHYGDMYGYDQADRLAQVIRGVGYHTGAHDLATTATSNTTNYVTMSAYARDNVGNRETLAFRICEYWSSER